MNRNVRDRVERRMRDRARGRDMERDMNRDMRNPYGSRGGYVVSDKRRDYDYDMARDRDYARRERDRADYNYDYAGDYAYDRADYRYRDGHYNDYESDMRGDYRDYRDYNDYGDYRRDYRDYGEDMYMISKKDMKEWKRDIVNSDGTRGEHFPADKIISAAQQMGVKFDKYSENDLAMTANMLYSDFGKTLKTVISPDREMHVYAALAKDFLEDPDAALEGAEKLAVYYNCIVKDE